jgi:hypothetical protein
MLFKACGGDLPDPMTSGSNIVYIVFNSIPVRLGSKFLLEWLQVERQIPSVTTQPPISEYQGISRYITSH